jgi:hypothetical protein
VGDRIGNKERGKHIDRIVEMRQENDTAKKDGGGDEQEPERATLPKDERHQERQSGVAGEKKVSAKGKPADEIRINGGLRGEWPKVRQTDEDGADDDEKRDRFEGEREPVEIFETQKSDQDPKYDWAVNIDPIDIKDADV